MTHEEYVAVLGLLGENPSEQAIQQAVVALGQMRAVGVEAEVRDLVRRTAGQRAASQAALLARFYPFLTPPQRAKEQDEYGNVVMSQPRRREVKVRLTDLASFCRDQGLSEKAMIEVGEGKRLEHKGWMRAGSVGRALEQGRPYREPDPERDPQPKEPPTVRERYQQPLPAVTYTPKH
jgi:hypothetical protein